VMKQLLLFIFILILSNGFAQQDMETDRPDQTECSSVVLPNSIQLETGYVYTHDKAGSLNRQNYATTLIRIGVLKSIELRVIAGEYEQTKTTFHDSVFSAGGFAPIEIGTKISICEENGILPQTVLLGHLTLPIGDEKYITKNAVSPDFRFSMSHTLTKKLSLGYNLGMEWENNSEFPIYVYTATIGADLSSEIGAYIETFGNFAYSALPECYFDLGFTYSIFPNLQLDAAAGVGLNEFSNDYFISAGFSFRFEHK
jgi:hypothetical protein